MNYKNSLLFFCAIAVQAIHATQTANDFPVDDPAKFAQQINEKLMKNEPIDYQLFADLFKKTFASSGAAVQFLNKAEQAGPQAKELRQEILKLSLCFDDIEVNERLFYDENNSIIQDIYEKNETVLLKTNFEKQRRLKKVHKDPKDHSYLSQRARLRNQIDFLYDTQTIIAIRKKSPRIYNDPDLLYALTTQEHEIYEQIKAVEKKIELVMANRERFTTKILMGMWCCAVFVTMTWLLTKNPSTLPPHPYIGSSTSSWNTCHCTYMMRHF
ncbi:hypothetical protein IPH25_00560 [bacterium]|nr:MAG: hypothetical protein IPG37_02680 [bacterium]QQR61925.1 MAG: hypothetical protein IPH25_00560 [bacterium]QQR62484.1 MAG: hypothetical protein IPH67_03620 [bacterium]